MGAGGAGPGSGRLQYDPHFGTLWLKIEELFASGFALGKIHFQIHNGAHVPATQSGNQQLTDSLSQFSLALRLKTCIVECGRTILVGVTTR